MPRQQVILKPVCSVSELARRCGFSRSRWYDLMRDGVMPHPCYCVRTRRPLYPRELQEVAIRVRQTNTSPDGRYVMFYERSGDANVTTRRAALSRPPERLRGNDRVREMAESLAVLLPEASEPEIRAGITACYPGGLPEDDFEAALTTVFRHLRRTNGG